MNVGIVCVCEAFGKILVIDNGEWLSIVHRELFTPRASSPCTASGSILGPNTNAYYISLSVCETQTLN